MSQSWNWENPANYTHYDSHYDAYYDYHYDSYKPRVCMDWMFPWNPETLYELSAVVLHYGCIMVHITLHTSPTDPQMKIF